MSKEKPIPLTSRKPWNPENKSVGLRWPLWDTWAPWTRLQCLSNLSISFQREEGKQKAGNHLLPVGWGLRKATEKKTSQTPWILLPFTQKWTMKAHRRDSWQKQATVLHVLYRLYLWLFTSFEHGWLCTEGASLPTSDLPIMEASPPEDGGSCTCLFTPPFLPSIHPTVKGNRLPYMQLERAPVRPGAPPATGGLQNPGNSRPQGGSHLYLCSFFQSQVEVTF